MQTIIQFWRAACFPEGRARSRGLQLLIAAIPLAALGFILSGCSSASVAWEHSSPGSATAIEITESDSPAPEAYPKLPVLPASKVYRRVLKAIPYTRTKAFHGNYGGSGNSGGAPVDRMDEMFRRHDILYIHANTMHERLTADRELVASLQRIDPEKLDDQAKSYRERAISFFSSPGSRIIGKPLAGWFARPKSSASRLRSERLFKEFMQRPGHPRGIQR